MSTYQHILLTVELSEDSLQVGQRAVEIGERLGARITVLHVVEFVPVEPMGEALLPAVPIEEELVANARRRLDELAARLGLEDSPKSVEVGSIKAEVVRVAAEVGSDLIVLGNRERHGLAMLLNFTEDTVLHSAPCDVLAVRLPG